MALGVRKVYEGILRDGRAIIVTDKNRDNYEWNDIPDGSKFIDTETGLEYVKLKGQSDWVPAHVKNDGTICIAKDAIIETEVFYVKEILDNELVCEKEDGEIRHFPKTKDGFFVIEIENGTYPMGRNYLSVFINDIFLRTQENEGILEMTPNRFKLLENPAIGMKITAKYYRTIKIGNPYPRIFMKDEDPGVENAEEGDIWIDTDALIDQEGNIDIGDFENGKIPWSMISGTPTTLAGYHISDKVSLQGHLHNKSDIVGFPNSMPANGGDSETVAGKKPGTGTGDLAVLGAGGKIAAEMLADHTHEYLPITGGQISGNIKITDSKETMILGVSTNEGLYFSSSGVGFKNYETDKMATIATNISGNAATATKATTAALADKATYSVAIAEPKLVTLYESSDENGLNHGDIILSEPYTNFKALYIEHCHDRGGQITDEIVQVWQLKRRKSRTDTSNGNKKWFNLCSGWEIDAATSTTTLLKNNSDHNAARRIKRISGIR